MNRESTTRTSFTGKSRSEKKTNPSAKETQEMSDIPNWKEMRGYSVRTTVKGNEHEMTEKAAIYPWHRIHPIKTC
jgi:hypothetical protein